MQRSNTQTFNNSTLFSISNCRTTCVRHVMQTSSASSRQQQQQHRHVSSRKSSIVKAYEQSYQDAMAERQALQQLPKAAFGQVSGPWNSSCVAGSVTEYTCCALHMQRHAARGSRGKMTFSTNLGWSHPALNTLLIVMLCKCHLFLQFWHRDTFWHSGFKQFLLPQHE
jgi:hypothetical protein